MARSILVRRSQQALRRTLVVAVATLLPAGGLVLAGGSPANASVTSGHTPVSWAYSDSRQRDTAFVDGSGNAPLGAWRSADGKVQRSRSYFTFDLSDLTGSDVLTALAIVRETNVNNCTAQRRIQIWLTDTVAAPTWNNPPAEREMLSGTTPAAGCPASYAAYDIASGLSSALNAGQTRVTLEVRLAAAVEDDFEFGRAIDQHLYLSITHNKAPLTPTELRADYYDCTGQPAWLATTRPTLTARLDDPDNAPGGSTQAITATFAIWPTDRPEERTTFSGGSGYAPLTAWGQPPLDLLKDGTRYTWQVRGNDGLRDSPWSATCTFGVDTTPPATAPTVSSTDYPPDDGTDPHGGVGIPGTFTFDANGDTDVLRFAYRDGSAISNYVDADQPGGTATIRYVPTSATVNYLYVAALDRAGLRSAETRYEFRAWDTQPTIVDSNPDGEIGSTHVLTFQPNHLDNVVSYRYSLNDGAEQTVAAGTDGTAQVDFVPVPGSNRLSVWAVTSAGYVSGAGGLYLYLQTPPLISSSDFPRSGAQPPPGTTGTFLFRPGRMPGVVDYVYNLGGTDATVAAGADGSALLTWTAPHGGSYTLVVRSRTADGTESDNAYYRFSIRSNAPVIDSSDYPEYVWSGGPGVLGSFYLTPRQANVTSWVWTLDNGTEQSIAADPDGLAVLLIAPQFWGYHYLNVRSVDANGLRSDETMYLFVADACYPTLAVSQEGSAAVLRFTNSLPGATGITYQLDADDPVTVPIGADGSATVRIDGLPIGDHYVGYQSVAPGGFESARSASGFYLADPSPVNTFT